MLIKIAKSVLLLNSKIYAITYLGVIILLALIFDYIHVPMTDVISDKDGPLNKYFMRVAYVYLYVLLIPFMFCVHLTLYYGDIGKIMLPAIRAVLFMIFESLISDYIINGLSEIIGTCENHPEYDNEKIMCQHNGFEFLPLDISGHMYHVFYSMLILIEECRYYVKWEEMGETIDITKRMDFGSDKASPPQKLYQLFSGFVKLDFIVLGIFMISLHLNNLHTIIYYHTIFELISGAAFAILLWFFTYRVIFAFCESDIKDEKLPLIVYKRDSYDAL